MKRSIIALALLGAVSGSVVAADNKSDDTSWVFRGALAYVVPDDSSGPVLGNDGVAVDSSLGLGLSLTYMMNRNWGVELLAASPFKHDIVGMGDLEGLDIGKATQLPPTLSLTYYWGDTTTYHVGAGLNYTKFFSEKTTSALTAALGATETDLKLDASTGLSLQVGFDTPITDNWNLSAIVYWKDIDTTADVIVDGVTAASVDVQIDPIVWTLGVSTRF
ncbi:MAG: outer membrane beta-barrel protein [Kangiellaceae bacterium]|nr:outer membrane beta-barrel protein [Kangiellaceae bacterium]